MAYLVLARRYRPQSFAELIGQEHIVTILTNAIQSGRIHHAFLFTGARGTGKTSTARLLAKALNCAEGPTSAPCNTCSHCEDIMAGKEVDVLEIDGATNTGVENVRALREDIRFLPTAARYRIVIIDEVHMLTVSAFNALLKTLEEPPAHIIFIFATTEPHKIPITILSRVQRFDFKRVHLPLLAQHVKTVLEHESFTIEEEAATLIAMEGEGSVRDTLSILDQILANHVSGTITTQEVKGVLGITDRQVLWDMGQALLRRDGAEVFRLLNTVFYEGYDLVHFTKSLVNWLRDLVVVKTVPAPQELVFFTDAELNALHELLSAYSVQHLHHLFLRLFNGFDTVSRSLIPKTALELLLMDLVLAEPLVAAKELFATLNGLESRLKASYTPKEPPPRPTSLPTSPHHPHVSPQSTRSPSRQPHSPSRSPSLMERFSALGSPAPSTDSASPPSKAVPPEAPPTPVAPHPIDFQKWTALLDSISTSHGRACVVLQEARFTSTVVEGALHITLYFSQEKSFALRYINAERSRLEGAFRAQLGFPVVLRFEKVTSASMAPSWHQLQSGEPIVSPLEVQKREEALRKRKLEETIKSEPLIRRFLNDLGGSITGQREKQVYHD